ncbi:lipopolysaccharide biosynthesis protein [Vibrio cyclitrophicus]|uniref:lipopolysaccharide biosynthesis protein n=1 Tax=Vibrio cyclitrophicus TaxID=47951 RepID=UPI002068A3A4|nr:lipopolysaccharide biosynthesis protein [Vibrio cyclitrophicus]UPR26464.1 lipopolysaccharide biosynthesis protein [Vibrio cyclitrophicus]
MEKKLAKALKLSVIGRYTVYAVQTLSMMLMARLFTPEQFGIFAAIQVFVLFFMLFGEMGIAPALINEKKIRPRMRDGVFTFTWVLGVIVAIIFVLLSPLISDFYNNEIYNYLIIPISISVIFYSGSIVPLASLQRDKLFINIAKADILSEVICVILVLVGLSYLDPVYVLSLKALFFSIFRCFFLWLNSSFTITKRAKFGLEIGQVRSLLGFSSYQFGFNFVNYFSRNLDTILVGKYFSSASLGVYDKAYQLMRYPLQLLTFAMTPAIQPVLREIKGNAIEFERLHNKFIRYMSILGLAVGGAVYFSSDYIVLILLGEAWSDVTPLLQILSVTIPIQIVLSSSGGFFQAAGRADLLFVCGLFSSVTNVIAIILGISSGNLQILTWLLVISFSINFFQAYYIMGKYILPSGCFGVFKEIKLTLLIKAIFIIFVYWVKRNEI